MKSNKEVVLEFYEKVFNAHDLSQLDSMMLDNYKQHSAGVADGKAGFIEFAKGFFTKEPRTEIVKVVAEDDLVCIFFKCNFNDGTYAKVFDLYRLEDGKLAEHWDCPMRADNLPCNHPNGHF